MDYNNTEKLPIGQTNGSDQDNEISLCEYGAAIRGDVDGSEVQTLICVYGTGTGENEFGEPFYNEFNSATVNQDIDPITEWDFVRWEELNEHEGRDVLSFSLSSLILSLIGYYGYQEIFGAGRGSMDATEAVTLIETGK